MIGELVSWVGNLLGLGGQLSLAVTLLAVALYWKKAKMATSVVGNAVAYVVVVCVALGILMIFGVVDLDLGQGMDVGRTAFELIKSVVSVFLD